MKLKNSQNDFLGHSSIKLNGTREGVKEKGKEILISWYNLHGPNLYPNREYRMKLTHRSTSVSFWERCSGERATEAPCLYCFPRFRRRRRPEAEAPVPVSCSCSGVSRVTSPKRHLFVVLRNSSIKHHWSLASTSTGTAPLSRTSGSPSGPPRGLWKRHRWSLRDGCLSFRLASGQGRLRTVNAMFSKVEQIQLIVGSPFLTDY